MTWSGRQETTNRRFRKLAPLLVEVTQLRSIEQLCSIEKRYSFLPQRISEEKRNTIHWMVVSDELFKRQSP